LLVICVDYSGNRVKIYGLIAIKEENLAILASFLLMFPHYSEIKEKWAKTKILKVFSRRYSKVQKYIEKLVVSRSLENVVRELKRLKGEIEVIYANVHVYRRVKHRLKV